MQTAIDQYRVNIGGARNLGLLARDLGGQTTGAPGLSDMLRSELVLAVSALDYFIHEIVRLGMLEIYNGNRQSTDQFQRFQISMANVSNAILDPSKHEWLEREIIDQHSRQSFQSYDNIANAVRLFYGRSPWPEVSARINMETQDIKDRLNLIVDRRNKIVHESDMRRPSYLNQRFPIEDQMVEDAVAFIERISEAIYEVVIQTN